MRVKILGAHQGESSTIRFISFLVDDRLVIDAGGLTSTTTLDQQLGLDTLLITHRHIDHIKDLVAFHHNGWQTRSTQVYCLDDVRDALQANFFNGVVWPDVTQDIRGYFPLVYHSVQPGRRFDLLGYSVLPIEVSHTVPAVGYLLERDGKRLFYTADTRAVGNPGWAEVTPDLLLAECTMGSAYEEVANYVGHMTPLSLGNELRAFRARQGYIPRTVCVHMNPHHEEVIAREITDLAADLGADITLAREGMDIEV